MTDDIVTRLREHALGGIWDFTKCAWDIQDAADEIERLRNQIHSLEAERDQWQRQAFGG